MIKVKICGMKDQLNIREVAQLRPDYLGFIFYPGSERYVGENVDVALFKEVPRKIKRVGVFVNEHTEKILELAYTYELDIVQLHGSETPKDCMLIKSSGYQVIKAFGMDAVFNFTTLMTYLQFCDYFLFDTKSLNYGGTGQKFNWDKIKEYHYNVPFFLSGGIGPDDYNLIRQLNHPLMVAVDINSQFETAPGMKNIHIVRNFIKRIKEDHPVGVGGPRRGGHTN
jgi:phosphoribosylanthranilate isomerase